MSDITDVVKVDISIADVGVTRQGFGILCMMAPYVGITDRVQFLSKNESPNVDTNNAIARAKNACFRAEPKPSLIAIGRIAVDLIFVGAPADVVSSLSTYGVTVLWNVDEEKFSKAFSYSPDYNDAAEVMTNLAQQINDDDAVPHGAEASGDYMSIFFDSEKSEEIGPDAKTLGLLPWAETDDVVTSTGKLFVSTWGREVRIDEGDILPETEYEFRLNFNKDDRKFDFETDANPTLEEFFASYKAAADAKFGNLYGTILSSDSAFTFALEGGARVEMTCDQEDVSFVDIWAETPAEAAALNREAQAGWYATALVDRSIDHIMNMADVWAEPNFTIFGFAHGDIEIVGKTPEADSETTFGQSVAKAYDRSFGDYHPSAIGEYDPTSTLIKATDQWQDMEWLCSRLTVDLDVETATWKFANLPGTTTVKLTSTQKINLLGTPDVNGVGGKKGNFYDFVGGKGIMREGSVFSGEWIDTIIGRDWLTARMQENIFSALTAKKKTPFTDAGIAVIVNQVHASLQKALQTGFLVFDSALSEQVGYSVTYPKRSQVLPADRQNRLLTGVTFEASIAGAIHIVKIIGTISA